MFLVVIVEKKKKLSHRRLTTQYTYTRKFDHCDYIILVKSVENVNPKSKKYINFIAVSYKVKQINVLS